jgi:elongation factor 1-alpha
LKFSCRVLQKLSEEANYQGKASFKFAFFFDNQTEERARGITIKNKNKSLLIESKQFTMHDTPGLKYFIKNMIRSMIVSEAAILVLSAGLGEYESSISLEYGTVRRYLQILSNFKVKQLLIVVNKMDSNGVNYSQNRFEDIKSEMIKMLLRLNFSKDFIENYVPFIPISAWFGDNLTEKSNNLKQSEIKILKYLLLKTHLFIFLNYRKENQTIHFDVRLLNILEKISVIL